MAAYRYKAKAEDGKVVLGKIEAADEQAFYRELEKRRLYCISYKEVGMENYRDIRKKLNLKELNIFCRELGVMISAGVPMVDALNTMYRRSANKKLKSCYMALMEQLEKGSSMKEAMEGLGNTFPEILIAMVGVGEQSGDLDKVVSDMAEFYAKEHATKSKIQTMMIYPTILIVVTIAVIIGVFTFVLPKFFALFGDGNLPGITRVFMAFSNFLVNDWHLLLLILLFVIIGVVLIGQTEAGRYYMDKFKCSIPVISKLLEKSVIARFSNTMGILINSGISVLEAIKICSATLGNTYTQARLMRIREEVEKGVAFSDSMEREKLFDDLVWSMMATGEETGQIGEMYQKLYAYYEQESAIATQKLMAIMEPAVLLIIGVIIGLVMMSVLLPIYGIYA